jgi:phage terminase small subunit
MVVSGGLTAKQEAFVEAYLDCGFNSSEAARRAKYTGKANVIGPRLLAQVSIKAAIRQAMEQRAMPSYEVLARIADQARSTMEDFLNDAGDIDLNRARERGKLHLVKTRAVTKEGERIELYSAQSALELLAKHHGLLTDNIAISGDLTVKGYVSISPDDFDNEASNPPDSAV